MRQSENTLRAVRFERPDYIPMRFGVTAPCWAYYPQDALKELMVSHPLLFPGYKPPAGEVTPKVAPWRKAGAPYTDSWGCEWETPQDGITGAVRKHPMETWDAFADFRPPDPVQHDGWGPIDWDRVASNVQQAKANGGIARGSLRHGHTFLTLTYIRGYENVLFDMADGEPRLRALLDMVEAFNAEIVRRYMSLGVDWMGYPEDLGMQVGPMLSPEQFRQYIKPSYQRLMAPARDAGCIVHMHSDGDIRTLVDDLIDGGVEVINLQDLVNGIDWIQQRLAGRTCIDLDVDRQSVTRFGAPAQVDALIREAVQKLGSREGGLMMTHGLCPGPPLENVKALMDAMERYATYYA